MKGSNLALGKRSHPMSETVLNWVMVLVLCTLVGVLLAFAIPLGGAH